MADDRTDDHKIVGVWRLAAQVYEDVETGEQFPIGEHPKGRQIGIREGRWIALATGEGRPFILPRRTSVVGDRCSRQYARRGGAEA